MTCRVFLVGEGPTDIGDLFHPPGGRPEPVRDGFLQPMLRNLVGDAVALTFFDGRRLVALKAAAGKQPHHWLQRRKAAQALALATELDADALVFSCDADKAPGPATAVERRKRLREIRQSIEEGFATAREKDPAAERVLTAIAVPARMIEAWALGDREALADLLGVPIDALAYRRPEELSGKSNDPSSNHPKSVWQRITNGEVSFDEIGRAARPDALRQTCPESFGPFANDVESALDRCPERRTSAAPAGRASSRRRTRRRR